MMIAVIHKHDFTAMTNLVLERAFFHRLVPESWHAVRALATAKEQ